MKVVQILIERTDGGQQEILMLNTLEEVQTQRSAHILISFTAEGKWRFLSILLAEEYIELMLDIAEGKVSKSLFIQCWR